MTLPDLSNIPLPTLFAYLFIVAFADTAWNVLLSFVHGNFSAAYVADFIRTHILLRVFAIGLTGSLGAGWPGLGIPAIPAASLAASLALAAYVVETIASLKEGLTDTRPVPTPPTPTPEG